MFRPLKKEKLAKARTRTIVKALSEPSIAGESPDLNEDHMDEQMEDEFDLFPFHNEYREAYPDSQEHYEILKDTFQRIKFIPK